MADGGPFVVDPADDEPIMDAVARGLAAPGPDLAALPTLTGLAMGDPYFAEQLLALRAGWAVARPAGGGPLARLRAWLAWRLLGPELAQINATHGQLVRLVESLASHLDDERAARARLGARVQELEHP